MNALKRSDTSELEVVIVASGNSTRLAPLTNYIPKLLLNIRNRTLLEWTLEYWAEYTTHFTLVVHSRFIEMVRFYTKAYPNLTISIVPFDQASGTADTIQRTTQQLHGRPVLFTWSDIVPVTKIPVSVLDNPAVVFVHGDQCRYRFVSGAVRKEQGNVVGLYYFKKFSGLPRYKPGEDICDVINDLGVPLSSYELPDLIDIGDMEKFHRFHDGAPPTTRFFNRMTETPQGTLIKQATNSQGQEIIAKEIRWYQFMHASKWELPIPRILEYGPDWFEMERVPAQSLFKSFGKLTVDKQRAVVQQFIEQLALIHSVKREVLSTGEYERHVLLELEQKVLRRNARVQPLVDAFGPVHTVNGLKVMEVTEIIEKFKRVVLIEERPKQLEFCSIVGDCQFGNTLYDPATDRLTFVDPRGYFGESQIMGPAEYDHGKLLFGLSGYDHFNDNYLFSIDRLSGDGIELSIPAFEATFPFVNRVNTAYMVSVWLGLAQYFENHPLKCVAAYYYGRYLGTRFCQGLPVLTKSK